MREICPSRAIYAAIAICSAISVCTLPAFTMAETDSQDPRKKETVEPVFRVPKIGNREQLEPREIPDSVPNPPTSVLQQSGPRPPVDIARQILMDSASTSSPVDPTPVSNVTQPPVARVAMATEVAPLPDNMPFKITPDLKPVGDQPTAHPLDRAIELARNGLDNMRQNVNDYTAILVKRERVDNRLSEPSYMRIKIRNPRQLASGNAPFSIYMKFIKPRGCAGREVIWVDGQNDNNLIAHETGALLRFRNFHLQPTGMLAMRGNRYPIYEAGIENLTLKLIEKAERDRKAGKCEVNYTDVKVVNKRPCMVIEVVHRERKSPYEFHIAKVYIDEELGMPIRFASYDWPLPGQKPKLMEEYTYINLKLNVGLTDNDFSIANPAYNFAK